MDMLDEGGAHSHGAGASGAAEGGAIGIDTSSPRPAQGRTEEERRSDRLQKWALGQPPPRLTRSHILEERVLNKYPLSGRLTA